MERFVKGEVVVVPFPFSDLTQAKRRPALVRTEWEGEVVYGRVAQVFILVVARFIEPKKTPDKSGNYIGFIFKIRVRQQSPVIHKFRSQEKR